MVIYLALLRRRLRLRLAGSSSEDLDSDASFVAVAGGPHVEAVHAVSRRHVAEVHRNVSASMIDSRRIDSHRMMISWESRSPSSFHTPGALPPGVKNPPATLSRSRRAPHHTPPEPTKPRLTRPNPTFLRVRVIRTPFTGLP
jgi:hypothetical protein